MALSNRALITVDELATLFPSFATDVTAQLEATIETASELIYKELKRDYLLSSSLVEYFDGGEAAYCLKAYPVGSITEVAIDGEVIAAELYNVSASGVLRFKTYTSSGYRNVKITYVGGYANVAAIPADLKSAVAQTVHSLRQKIRGERIGIRSQMAQDGVQTTYDNGAIPYDARQILANYKAL